MDTAVSSMLDYSMIGDSQLVHLCLQRSNRLKKIIPSRADAGDGWNEQMLTTVQTHRRAILDAVTEEITELFDKIEPAIAVTAPRRLADLGCGQAFVDLLIHRRFGCDLVLIDIEQSDDIHFGFAEEGAGYADLANARAFLVANGIPDRAITTINPRQRPLAEIGSVDMAISLISCGFHYPVETYDAFFRTQVEKAILLDCRNGKRGERVLANYGNVTEIGVEKRHSRQLCIKT